MQTSFLIKFNNPTDLQKFYRFHFQSKGCFHSFVRPHAYAVVAGNIQTAIIAQKQSVWTFGLILILLLDRFSCLKLELGLTNPDGELVLGIVEFGSEFLLQKRVPVCFQKPPFAAALVKRRCGCREAIPATFV